MKTPEELNTLKEEFETLNKKLSELTDDELSLVTGGYVLTELPKLREPEPNLPEQHKREMKQTLEPHIQP